MRKVNMGITIGLSVLSLSLWFHCWWKAARPGVSYFSTNFDYVKFPTILATVLTACACLGWVMVTRSADRGDGECRCRKCGYILRGITEPRCPECGTAI